MKVFVQLPAHLSLENWQNRYKENKIIGINDPNSPYGYQRAEKYVEQINFSIPTKFIYLARFFRKLTGMDILNVYINRKKILKADVVWTHTEAECLAVAFLLLLYRNKSIKIIGQCVWLMDKWDLFSSFKKYFYKKLICRINVLTFHSPINASEASLEFPSADVRVVKFGIPTEKIYSVKKSLADEKIKIVSVGNDIHRNWDSLIKACGNKKNIKLTIISTTIEKSKVEPYSNIEIKTFNNKLEFIDFFKSNDFSIVPLVENKHASGLTAIQESIILGVPVLVSKVGGLDYYFENSHVTYFDNDLEEKIDSCINDYDSCLNKAKSAQKYILDNIGSELYIKEHIFLSSQILK